MSILNKLASSLGRRDEIPNQELAAEIARDNDQSAIKELVANLDHASKAVQSDCVKVLYEIGGLKPGLISAYHAELVKLLDSKNNRLQWGAMTALNTITDEIPDVIFKNLGGLVSIAETGSVITKDQLMAILTKLAAHPGYEADAFAIFIEQLAGCPGNQLPMYAENALPIISDWNREIFAKTLHSRLNDLEKESKRKRVEKVLKKIQAK